MESQMFAVSSDIQLHIERVNDCSSLESCGSGYFVAILKAVSLIS